MVVEQRDKFIPHLANLLGIEVGDPTAFRRALIASIKDTIPGAIQERSLSHDDVRNFVYRDLANTTTTETPSPAEQAPVIP